MKAISGIFILVLFASCTFPMRDPLSGNGNVQLKTIPIDSLDAIQVSDRIDAEFYTSDSMKIQLVADENLHDHIHIDLRDERLTITCDKYIRVAKSKTVKIYAPSFHSIKVTDGASFTTPDSVYCGDVYVSAGSGGDIQINGVFENIYVEGNSAADITLIGKCNELQASVSSASDLSAFDLSAAKVYVNASSAADVKVTVLNEADFEVSSAADIYYQGDPEILNSASSSAGSIKKVKN